MVGVRGKIKLELWGESEERELKERKSRANICSSLTFLSGLHAPSVLWGQREREWTACKGRRIF